MRSPRLPVTALGAPVALAALLAFAPAAHAGGIGVLVHGGAHGERVHYYANENASGPISDPKRYPQYYQNQTLPQFGAGLEFILGDRDDAITGVFRVYYNQDAPQSDPAKAPADGVKPDSVVSAHRDRARHTGMASMGLNWGFLGNPDKFQAGLSAHLGSGFLTNDHTEFFNLQLGPTVNYRLGRQFIGFVDVHATARFRKEFGFGAQGMAGMRYMFD